MAYLDTQPFGRKLANLGTAGAIELAIGAALIAGLSVTVIPKDDVPQITARNIPVPSEPLPPEPQPSRAPVDSVITAPEPQQPIDTTPSEWVTPNVIPTASLGDTFVDPGPVPTAKPSPRYTPVPPKPVNAPSNWVTTGDYPARDLREGNQGVTTFRVIVGSNGRVQSCEVVRSSGFTSLDDAACRNVTRRARFESAVDESGAKVVGSYTSSVRWQIPR